MTANDILADILAGESLWPWNAHLMEDRRIEDAVRYALKYRGQAIRDVGPALITPRNLVMEDNEFVVYPVSDSAEMLAKMDYVQHYASWRSPEIFQCAKCHRQFMCLEKVGNDAKVLWISAPPSIVGIALHAKCAAPLIDEYKPVTTGV